MSQLHSALKDTEYWELRFSLLNLQEKVLSEEAYRIAALDLVEDLDAYLNQKETPWDIKNH